MQANTRKMRYGTRKKDIFLLGRLCASKVEDEIFAKGSKSGEVGWKKFKSFFASNGVSVQLDAFSCQEKVLPLPFHRDTGKDAAEKCFQL